MKSLQVLIIGLSLLINGLNALPQPSDQNGNNTAARAIKDLLPDDTDDFIYEGRIVGGYPTNIRNFPYQGSLQRRNTHLCGCAIIGKNLIITAAHCVEDDWNSAIYSVRVGATNHRYGGQLIAARRIIKHEDYSSSTMDNDIALILLASDIVFSEDVQKISLAAAEVDVPAQSSLLISGWGLTWEGGSVVSQLRYVAVQFVDQATCVANYKLVAPITDRMFCASTARKDSCQGDSGGPLVGRNPVAGGDDLLYGIVSWGVGCAQRGYPGVYVKISAFENWIEKTATVLNFLTDLFP